ncbi:MAG: hypothetical protein RLO81_01355 [Fulvivirga sp.]|uniref:hypothetical protein n=1 Tax=Fulvivirga sp. TaxID=1931237 RepID=UPI0032EE1C98
MKVLRSAFVILSFIILGFFLGGYLASLSLEYPSGLAGPGIVVGTGLFGAAIGLILSLIILANSSAKRALVFALTALIISVLVFLLMLRAKQLRDQKRKQSQFSLISFQQPNNNQMGLGMVKPNFFEKSTLYFYQPQLKKSVNEHIPIDSLVFKQTELGYTITYAPPWFYPEFLKMDYDILFMKCMSTTKDWVQVVVNKQTGRTMWMDIHDVKVEYWPSFLLNTYSIKIDEGDNPLKVKPIDNSSDVNLQGIYKPVEIKSDWIRVEIYNDTYQMIGEAWVRWCKNGVLQVDYEILS